MYECMYVYVSKQSYMLENNYSQYTHVWQANANKGSRDQRLRGQMCDHTCPSPKAEPAS